MIPFSNEELYKVINKENETLEKFRAANPQFKINHTNVASTLKEIEYFEQLYSHMGIGCFEFAPSDFNFKRADTYTFQQIFSDNFYSFLEDNPSINIRPIVIEEVEKMLTCQDPDYGHAIYECPICHKTHIVPFTCKSRFCNTCAIKYQMDRALEITSKLIRCEHRHVVFTIPEQLRIFFIRNRHLLDILFKAVEECIKYIFKKRAPKKKYTPGVILVLHTFGRDLKFNPHIHCLITEGASSNIKNCTTDDIWINFTHFNYEAFRKSFQYSLLKYMKKYLRKTLSSKEFSEFQQIVDEDDMYVVEKVHVYDLIKRLIIHIPEKNFKMLRYAGLYSSHKCVHFDKLIKKLSDIVIRTRKSLANSRKDVSKMSDDELLDMDYFLNEDLGDIFGFPSSTSCVLEAVQFKCKKCGCLEYIPKNVVDSLDSSFGDSDFPPTFSCEKCKTGTMFPVDYKSPRGIVYKFNS